MGGCRCSYKNCKSTTKTMENLHFFHYPVKHKERCKIWIENANKPEFCNLEEDQLRNKVVCEVHFEDRWFPNSQKKRLLQGAVPTIDGYVEEEPRKQETTPSYLSPQLQDVQVLQANADGTIFVLDTDKMFNRSHKVESYIYKNGVIVPSNVKYTKQQLTQSKPSTSASSNGTFHSYVLENSYDSMPNSSNMYHEEPNMLEETPEYKVTIKKEIPEYVEVLNKTVTHQNISERLEEEFDDEFEPKEEHIFEESNIQRKALPRSAILKNPSKTIMEKSVNKNYLRKIKQHSRDIACIKRMLKQKSLSENKPDTTTILNMMKDQLPSTFFTILNLNLNNKCDLTDDDVDFFTTIHKTSPEVYQLLTDKYKWNLPCVDVVESPME